LLLPYLDTGRTCYPAFNVFQFQRFDDEFFAGYDLQIKAGTGAALKREGMEPAFDPTAPTESNGRHSIQFQFRALSRCSLRDEFEAEGQSGWNHLSEIADLHVYFGHVLCRGAVWHGPGMPAGNLDHGGGDRQFVHPAHFPACSSPMRRRKT